MGVQAIMVIGDKKGVVFTTPASGLFVYPPSGSVSIVTVLLAADLHRLSEIESSVKSCLAYAKENNIYENTFVNHSILTTLDAGKGGVAEFTLATAVTNNNVGLMIHQDQLVDIDTNIVYDAHIQLLQAMQEQGRLSV